MSLLFFSFFSVRCFFFFRVRNSLYQFVCVSPTLSPRSRYVCVSVATQNGRPRPRNNFHFFFRAPEINPTFSSCVCCLIRPRHYLPRKARIGLSQIYFQKKWHHLCDTGLDDGLEEATRPPQALFCCC